MPHPIVPKFVRQSSKYVLSQLLGRSPYLRRRFGAGPTCLLYHRIVSHHSLRAAPLIDLAVREDYFAEQMHYLARNFRCISVDQAVHEYRVRGTVQSDTVCVTFDDGYRDNLLYALPILEQYRVPATIFVCSGLLERRVSQWWYELECLVKHRRALYFEFCGSEYRFELRTQEHKQAALLTLNALFKTLHPRAQKLLLKQLRGLCDEMMWSGADTLSWEELLFLDRHPLITIGAHTLTHPVLKTLTDFDLEREVRGSKSILEGKLKHPITLFAYPFGGAAQASHREYVTVKQVGYRAAFTTEDGRWTNRQGHSVWAMPRISVSGTDTITDFQWKVIGRSPQKRSEKLAGALERVVEEAHAHRAA